MVDLLEKDSSSDQDDYVSGESSEYEDDEEEVCVEEPEESTVQEQVVNEEFLEEGPKRGMIFGSREKLIAAYQSHGKRKGFAISIRRTTDIYIMIMCHRARPPKGRKSSQRIDCKARLNAVMMKDGRMRVSSVFPNHNHELDPNNSVFMAAHRVMGSRIRNQLENYDIAGLSTAKNVRLLEVEAGGPRALGVLKKDCRNYVEKRRRLRLGAGDAEAIHRLFLRLQKTDRNFFHLMDIDDKGRLRNVMWIHPRSIAAYHEFNEVVSFDTTYLVNKYDMPFATVVGVNHHHQSILLGCALLSNENSETFKWFWRNWLEAMSNVPPKAILTDQCDGIKNALIEVMPNTIHRLCIWHILSKVPKKFKGVDNSREAAAEFTELIYESLTITELESRWYGFVEKYKLQESRWISDLWEVRQSWIPVYLHHIFWAGMKSTQRSESMHSFFDGYINSRSSLKTFVEQYEVAIADKVWSEMHADYQSKTVVIRTFSVFRWEEQFQICYTNTIFQLFQEQIKGMMACDIINHDDFDEEVERFEVVDSGLMRKYHKQITFTVEYRAEGEQLDCECKMFNSKGVLCSHILKVLAKKNIQSVHKRYIMRRWRKDVVRRHSSIFSEGGYPHMRKEYLMFQAVEKKFQECTSKSYQDEARMKFLSDSIDEISRTLDNMLLNAVVTEEVEEELNHTPILDPPQITRRGRPRKNRLKPIEEIVKDTLKRKTKSQIAKTDLKKATKPATKAKSTKKK